jgi:hypothetical protein
LLAVKLTEHTLGQPALIVDSLVVAQRSVEDLVAGTLRVALQKPAVAIAAGVPRFEPLPGDRQLVDLLLRRQRRLDFLSHLHPLVLRWTN